MSKAIALAITLLSSARAQRTAHCSLLNSNKLIMFSINTFLCWQPVIGFINGSEKKKNILHSADSWRDVLC